MKSLADYITEGQAYFGPCKMHFKNLSTFLMFYMEMMGQISDGKYENSSPSSHWKWMSKINDYIIDGEEYYEGYEHQKKYNLREWVKKIKEWFNDNSKYEFYVRLYWYGKIGKIISKEYVESQKTTWKNGSIGYTLTGLSYVAETFGEALMKDPEKEWEEIEKISETSWAKKYLTSDIFNKENFEEFKRINYSLNEFLSDEKSMENSVNIYK